MNTFVMDPPSLNQIQKYYDFITTWGGGSNTLVFGQYKSIEVEYKSIEPLQKY
jgi:hypothetical protein